MTHNPDKSSQAADNQSLTSQAQLRGNAIRIWAIIGAGIIFFFVIKALGVIWPAVELLIVGLIVGFICSPLTNWLEDHTSIPRSIDALISLFVTLAVIVITCTVLLPPFIDQLVVFARQVPSYLNRTQDVVTELWKKYGAESPYSGEIAQVMDSITATGTKIAGDLVATLSSGIINNIMGMVGNTFTIFLGTVMGYWLAKDYPQIVRELAQIAGPKYEETVRLMLAVLSRSMGGYMRGVVITSVVVGILSFIGFTIIGQPYAGLMATLVGFLHIVPVIGPWIASGVAAALCLFVSPILALESIAVSMIAQNVTDNVVAPVVMQSAVKVHPALSLFGLIVGNSLGGILGMTFAIPLTAALKGVFVYFFELNTGRQIISHEGAIFKGRPFHDEHGNLLPSFDALDDDKFFLNTRLVYKDEHIPEVHVDDKPEGMPSNIGDIAVKSVDNLGTFVEEHVPVLGRSDARSKRTYRIVHDSNKAAPDSVHEAEEKDAHVQDMSQSDAGISDEAEEHHSHDA